MTFKLGAKEKSRELTLKDFQANPIWIEPKGEYGTVQRVKTKDLNVTKALFDICYGPMILCTVREVPKLFARGNCDIKDRNLSLMRFWQGGKWVEVKEIKARLPLTLVAVPKVDGETDVEYYLLTRHDRYAARIGGRLFRGTGPGKFKDLKLSRDMVPREIKSKAEPRAAEKKPATKEPPVRLVGAKLGPLVPSDKITVNDRIKHPVWVSTYEEDEADEDAQRAVIMPDSNASSDVIRKFLVPMLTFKVQGADIHGFGSYDRETDTLGDLQFWTGKRWERAAKLRAKFPLTLEPLCRILGKRNVRFVLKKSGNGKAVRVALSEKVSFGRQRARRP
jgi:hypothetical protein